MPPRTWESSHSPFPVRQRSTKRPEPPPGGLAGGRIPWRQHLFIVPTRFSRFRAASRRPGDDDRRRACGSRPTRRRLGLAGFAMTTFVLSMFNSNLVRRKGPPGRARPGARLRRDRAAARRHVGVPHRQHLRRRRVLLLRRLLDLVLGAERLLRQDDRRQRRARDRRVPVGVGDLHRLHDGGGAARQRGGADGVRAADDHLHPAGDRRRRPAHDRHPLGRLPRPGDRGRGLVRVVCGGGQLDLRTHDVAGGAAGQTRGR